MILTTTVKARLWGNQYKTLLTKGYVGNYGYGKNTVSQYLEFKELANGNKE